MKKVLVAASGGPDSMALLDKLNKENKYILHVAHVNYQKRESALRDENIVRKYCDRNHIPMYVLKPIFHHEENFQSWARKVRYQFFEEICQKKEMQDVYVAHHKDDVIETYIFQKQRDMLCEYYGMKDVSTWNTIRIQRPLLSYTKEELRQYCDEENIEYGIDESNLSDDYTRNKIRHSTIEHMSLKEKEDMMQQIKKENEKMASLRKEMESFFTTWNQEADLLLEKGWMYLEYYLWMHMKKHFSKKYCQSLCEQLKANCLIDLQTHYLERCVNQLYFVKKKDRIDFQLDHIEYKEYEDFIFSDHGLTIEGITLKEDDFPIRIRNVKENDIIQLRFGKKNIHRFFVDRKIPKHKRLEWIVVENVQKDVIFVPGIGCDIYHFSIKPTVFMVKYRLVLKEN